MTFGRRLLFAIFILAGGPDCAASELRPILYMPQGGDLSAERLDGTIGWLGSDLIEGDCVVGLAGWAPETAQICDAGGCSDPAQIAAEDADIRCLHFVVALEP